MSVEPQSASRDDVYLPCTSCTLSHDWCERYRDLGEKDCCSQCEHRILDARTAALRERLAETLAIESDQCGAFDDYVQSIQAGRVPPHDSLGLIRRTDMLLPIIKAEYDLGCADGTQETLTRIANIIGAVRTALADLVIDRPDDRARADELVLTLVGLEHVISQRCTEPAGR